MVLAVQDTTMLDCSPLQESTGGLARLGGGAAGSHGIPTHVTLALATSGRMPGILDINADFRDGVTPGTDLAATGRQPWPGPAVRPSQPRYADHRGL